MKALGFISIIGLILLNEFYASQCENRPFISKKLLFKDKKLYRVVPSSQMQIDYLKKLRSSNFGILFWNGIGEISDPVDMLSTPDLIKHVTFECIYMGMPIKEVFSDVSIGMTNNNVMQELSTSASCDIDTDSTDANAVNDSIEFAPIVKIDLTNLYTGLFYKISMKSFPTGWVTWAVDKNSDGDHYLEVDMDPNHLVQFDQCLTFDNQWTFGRTEVPGWFNFSNRGIPNGLATVNQEIKGSGQALVITSDPASLSRLSEFGDLRNHSLWSPIQSDYDNFYKLALKSMLTARITWTFEKEGDYSQYLIAATKLEDQILYEPGNKWYDDLLFKFELAAGLSLEATISDFEFTGTPKDLIEEMDLSAIKVKRIDTINIPNRSSASQTVEINETVMKWNNTFSYQFDQDLEGLMSKLKVHLNIEDVEKDCGDFVLAEGVNGRYTKSMLQIVKVQKKVKVPRFTSCYAYVEMEWAEGLLMPFNATMSISGTTDRVVADDNSKVASGAVPAGVIKEHLKSQGRNWNILDQTGESLVVKVSGVLTRSFLIGTTVSPVMIQMDNYPVPLIK